jgi:hypothetical protein
MPIVIAWIGEMLLSVVGQCVLSALVSVGIGFVASKATSGLIDATGIKAALGAAGPLVDYIGWFGIDTAMTIVLSAWAGRKITDAARVHLTSKRSS